MVNYVLSVLHPLPYYVPVDSPVGYISIVTIRYSLSVHFFTFNCFSFSLSLLFPPDSHYVFLLFCLSLSLSIFFFYKPSLSNPYSPDLLSFLFYLSRFYLISLFPVFFSILLLCINLIGFKIDIIKERKVWRALFSYLATLFSMFSLLYALTQPSPLRRIRTQPDHTWRCFCVFCGMLAFTLGTR